MIKKAFWVSLLVIACLVSSLWFFTPTATAFTKEQKLFLQSWRIVNRAYVDESFNGENWWFTREKFIKKPMRNREETYDVIEEMLALLDDPFTRLLRPKAYKSLQVSTSGELFGVGLPKMPSAISGTGFRSSTFPGVSLNASSSPLSLMIS